MGSLDLTLGIGWGRLAERGTLPVLGFLDDGFVDRPLKTGGTFGGESRSKSYFRGPASYFGGARYKFTRLPFEVLLEYNSDDYSREVDLKTIGETSPWNYSLEWRPMEKLNFAIAWLHGSSIGIRLSSSLDTRLCPDAK